MQLDIIMWHKVPCYCGGAKMMLGLNGLEKLCVCCSSQPLLSWCSCFRSASLLALHNWTFLLVLWKNHSIYIGWKFILNKNEICHKISIGFRSYIGSPMFRIIVLLEGKIVVYCLANWPESSFLPSSDELQSPVPYYGLCRITNMTSFEQ